MALVWLVARGHGRAAAQSAAVLAITLLLGAGAATALSPDGFGDSLQYHLDRPAQVESSPAGALTALEILGIGEAEPERSFGSSGVRHPQSGLVLALFTGLLVAVVALLAGSMTLRRPPGTRELVLAAFTAIAAFALFGKVFSPQFMIWVAPLTALAASWRMYPLAATLVAAQFLTLVEYPAVYESLTRNEHPAMLLVGLRNVVLAARDPARAAGLAQPGSRICSIDVARPSSPASTSTPLSHGSSSALSKRTAVMRRNFSSASSFFTPITPPRAPVMPTSVQ